VVADRDGEPTVLTRAAIEPLGGPPSITVAHALGLDAELDIDEHVTEMVENVFALDHLDQLSAPGSLPVTKSGDHGKSGCRSAGPVHVGRRRAVGEVGPSMEIG